MKFGERLTRHEVRKWAKITADDPLWYRRIGPESKQFHSWDLDLIRRSLGATVLSNLMQPQIGELRPARPNKKHTFYLIFEELLATNQIRLAEPREGYNWDSERQPIDHIVVHHSHSPIPMRPSYHSAMELLRIYAPSYKYPSPSDASRPNVIDAPIYSGHFDASGQQGFWAYHWLIARDGTPTRLLPDDAVGWHSGNWDMNCRSIGICVDDDLRENEPSNDQLAGVSTVIKDSYPYINTPHAIIGHRDVVDVECPGKQFSTWRGKLLNMLERL